MDYMGFYNRVNKISKRHSISSDSIDINSINDQQEIHRDIEMKNMELTTIWGKLTNTNSKPLLGQCVELIKTVEGTEGHYWEVAGYTITDEDGYYEFNVYEEGDDCEYNILVSCKDVNQTVLQENRACRKFIDTCKKEAISSYVTFY